MKAFSFVVTALFSVLLSAQKKEFGLPPTEIRPGSLHQGDLFTIKMVPGDKETSFYIVGRKTGALKADKVKMEAILDIGGEQKRFTLNRGKDAAYIFPKKLDKDIDLELKGEAPGEIDRLRIKIKP